MEARVGVTAVSNKLVYLYYRYIDILLTSSEGSEGRVRVVIQVRQ